jgi:signal transduction histidine kinase/integral membrane sensor domain MASE1/ActR/RegA family two-component response regulator
MSMEIQTSQRTAIAILALAVVYFLAGKFGLSLAIEHPSASAIWPPSGIALAALLLWGYRIWPGVFLGAFLVNITTEGGLAITLAIASGNTVGALAGAWLINHFANGRKVFERAKNIFKFVLLAALTSTAVSATIGVTSLTAGGYASWDRYPAIWFTWWLGDIAGDLLIAPLLVIWLTQPYPNLKLRRIFEAASLLLSILSIGYIVFLSGVARGLEYVLILPLLWAAFRFGQRGAVTAAFLTSAIALAGTVQGIGPFATAGPHEALLHLQGFTGTLAMAALVLAAVISERMRAEQRIEVQEAVSQILVDSPDLEEAGSKILQVLCERAKWSAGAIWHVDRTANQLVCVEFWHAASAPAPLFEAESRQRKFSSGVGLPGRVLSGGNAAWIPDVTKDGNFPRGSIAAQEGLRAAFGFPIKVAREVVGVVECLSREVREIDDDFLRTVNDIGGQLGRFIERKRADELLSQAKDELIKTNEQLERRVQARTGDLEQANAALRKNIDEQKHLEEQLRQAQKMESIGTLAGGIAHDFNNTLNIIRAYATLISMQSPANQQILENTKIINEEVERGAAVVRQLLTIARKTETRLARTDANQVVLMVSELIKQTFPKTIEVKLNLDRALQPVLADANQINQALLNICVNARDAMPNGGEITLATEMIEKSTLEARHPEASATPHVCIAVTDTGAGMDENVRSRVFEPFFTTKGFGEGTGLGLAMVYGIIKNHHGVVDLDSEPGLGTTFRLYLPAFQGNARSSSGAITEWKPAGRSPPGQSTVLIVEDEERMVQLLKNGLLREGYRVLVAMDGAEAIDLYERRGHEVDLVLMDLGLPKVNGSEVIRAMKKQNPVVNVIVTTGYIEPELKSELFETGVKDYIQKPYFVTHVLQRISEYLKTAEPSSAQAKI